MPKVIYVKVITIDAELDFTVQPNSSAQQVFNQVMKNLGLRETWYFGLQYVDNKGQKTWLKLKKKFEAHKFHKDPYTSTDQEPMQFKLLAKFYPEDVSEELIQEVTQRMFFVQVKEAVLNDDIYCPPEYSVMLASLAVQARYGNYNSDVHTEGCLANERLLPQRVVDQHNMSKEDWEKRVITLWGGHTDLMREEAMMKYLAMAQDLDMYGVNYFDIKNKKGTQLWFGVDAMGVNIYEKEDKLSPRIGFPWSEIRKISFNDKKFCIKPLDKKNHGKNINLYASRMRINKRILALCVGNHELYMRRRQKDSVEVTQMKIQAKEEMLAKQAERAQLKKEKAAREDAERQRRELEEKLKQFENQVELARKDLEKSQLAAVEFEQRLKEAEAERLAIQEAQAKAEEARRLAEEAASKEREERERLEAEAREAQMELERRMREAQEREEEARRLQQQAEADEEDDEEDGAEFDVDEEISSEDERMTQQDKDRELQDQLKALSDALAASKDQSCMTQNDLLHEDNVSKGRNKYKTLKQIRSGNTKYRIDMFEAM